MRKVLLLGLSLCAPGFSNVYFGGGGNLVDAVGLTPGVFTSDISVTDPGLVGTSPITIGLIGLQHTYVGDLSATLSYIDSFNNTLVTVDLFYRILDPGTPGGCNCQFGDGFGSGDTYFFNSTSGANIWAVAAGVGAANPIPGDTYFTTTVGGSANAAAFNAFAPQFRAGTWRLTITDFSPDDTGMILAWSLDLQTTPEPGTRTLSIVGLACLGLVLKKGQRKRKSAQTQ